VLGCAKFSRANEDDRLSRGPLGRVEGADGVVEGRDVADVGPQSSVPHPLDDVTQLCAIGPEDAAGEARSLLGRGLPSIDEVAQHVDLGSWCPRQGGTESHASRS
jgi:hypothetical protein